MSGPHQPRNDLTAAEIRAAFYYNPETGEFRRRHTNQPPPTKPSKSYPLTTFKGNFYKRHRLIWLHYFGEWPSGYIDHINGDKNDGRIANLREATQAENMMNARRRSDNSSGYKGVTWFPETRKWRALITVKGRQLHLGLFENKQDAYFAYIQAAKKMFGEFARLE